jgi:hypothetical protein
MLTESEGWQIYTLYKLLEHIKKLSGRYIFGLRENKQDVLQGSVFDWIVYFIIHLNDFQ